jgi:beta-glucosidase
MCSYNQINNSYACQNSKLLNGILKSEPGFNDFVMSDWGAQMSGVGSALAGLDMTMPCGGSFGGQLWGSTLATACNNGSVPVSRVNDMVTMMLAGWYYLGQDQNFPAVCINSHVNVQTDHGSYSRRIAADAIVLLKNEDYALPLYELGRIGVFGSDG